MSSVSAAADKKRASILERLRSQATEAPLSDPLADSTRKKVQPVTDIESIEQFKTVLAAHKTEFEELDTLSHLPHFMARWLSERGLAKTLYTGDNPQFRDLPWAEAGISRSSSLFLEDGQVALSSAECGIVETATLVLTSGPANPTRNNFLAAHHLITLSRQQLVRSSEQAWQLLQGRYAPLPRAVNFISGPSSSADVGLKLEYGAHGPASLTVILLT